MARTRGTDAAGRPFPGEVIDAVWKKGRPTGDRLPAVWRMDACGASICRFNYRDTDSQYGWEVDHIVPVAKGGTDDLDNLQPLQWETNRRKGDEMLWECRGRLRSS